mmetsp:Transcript_2609/g.8041  ORF Transcript_2609/g.8041 Transcript_2609/m.8041 type:complete len:219 (-) Transcript_2609:36-692(-)
MSHSAGLSSVLSRKPSPMYRTLERLVHPHLVVARAVLLVAAAALGQPWRRRLNFVVGGLLYVEARARECIARVAPLHLGLPLPLLRLLLRLPPDVGATVVALPAQARQRVAPVLPAALQPVVFVLGGGPLRRQLEPRAREGVARVAPPHLLLPRRPALRVLELDVVELLGRLAVRRLAVVSHRPPLRRPPDQPRPAECLANPDAERPPVLQPAGDAVA